MAASKGTVVLATDNSERALLVVDFALKHYSEGYDLHVVHVQSVHPNMMRHADETYLEAGLEQFEPKKGNGQASASAIEHQKFLVDKILPKFEAATKSSGKVQPVKTTIIYVPDSTAHGIGKAICKYAKNVSAEALVMERTSRNILSEFFLGSVASYCASHCPVPLVILKN